MPCSGVQNDCMMFFVASATPAAPRPWSNTWQCPSTPVLYSSLSVAAVNLIKSRLPATSWWIPMLEAFRMKARYCCFLASFKQKSSLAIFRAAPTP
eukprot:9475487-Pyramimonas_sp.AAC.2